MEEFLRYQRRIVLLVAMVAVVAGGALWLLWPDRWAWAVGGWWGTLGGLVVLRLKVAAICRFAQNPDKPPVGGGFTSFLIMAAFLGALVGGNHLAGSEIGNKWATFAGLLLPNVVLMLDGFLRPAGADKSAGAQTPGKEDSGEA